MTRTITIIGSVLFLLGGIGYWLHCLHPAAEIELPFIREPQS